MQRAPGLSTDSQGNFTHNYITEPSADGQYGDIPGYVTWNARVGYDFGPQASNLKLGLGVKNLFDKQYFTRSSDNNSGIYVVSRERCSCRPASVSEYSDATWRIVRRQASCGNADACSMMGAEFPSERCGLIRGPCSPIDDGLPFGGHAR